jgi:hypothetical protein
MNVLKHLFGQNQSFLRRPLRSACFGFQKKLGVHVALLTEEVAH